MQVSTTKVEAVSLEARYQLACTLAREAGLRAHALFRTRDSLVVEHKGVQDVVSVADREIEQFIQTRVRAVFPQDAFLGEETATVAGDLKSERVIWVVDPIDGTSCFLNGMHSWCVSISVVLDGVPVIGAVYDPNSGELFHAAIGSGAYVNDELIRVHPAATLRDGVLGVGFSHRVGSQAFIPFLARVLDEGGMFIRNGSGALMIAYVAAGRLIGYYEPHINSWDCLAGIVLVREAGGIVNDFLKGDGLTSGNVILAGGPALYPLLARHIDDTTHGLGPMEPMTLVLGS